MSPSVNDFVDPWKAAGSSRLFSFDLKLDQFSRLQEILLDKSGSVTAELEFSFNDARLPMAVGRLKGELSVQCQRCLEAMKIPVDQPVSVTFVRSGNTDQDLFEQYDLYEVEDEVVRPVDIIEDELLLLIPQLPMHSDPVCIIETEFGDGQPRQEQERENPFAVLASLKKN